MYLLKVSSLHQLLFDEIACPKLRDFLRKRQNRIVHYNATYAKKQLAF